jgi:hypothetical protein
MDAWLSDGQESVKRTVQISCKIIQKDCGKSIRSLGEVILESLGMSSRGGVCSFGGDTRSSKATY